MLEERVEGIQPEEPETPEEEEDETSDSDDADAPRKSRKGIFVVLGVLLLIAGIVGFGSLLSKPKATGKKTNADMVRVVLTTQPGQMAIEASPEIWQASRLSNKDRDTTGRDVIVRELKASADASRAWQSQEMALKLLQEQNRHGARQSNILLYNPGKRAARIVLDGASFDIAPGSFQEIRKNLGSYRGTINGRPGEFRVVPPYDTTARDGTRFHTGCLVEL